MDAQSDQAAHSSTSTSSNPASHSSTSTSSHPPPGKSSGRIKESRAVQRARFLSNETVGSLMPRLKVPASFKPLSTADEPHFAADPPPVVDGAAEVAKSLQILAARMGINMNISSPSRKVKYQPKKDVIREEKASMNPLASRRVDVSCFLSSSRLLQLDTC
jgi:hypothetical protein